MQISAPFKSIAIIGAGQVGTSAALAAALNNPEMQIVCYDTNPGIQTEFAETIGKAGIDPQRIKFTADPSDIRGAETVILATPVSEFGKAIKSIAPYVTNQTVFTDVGSVKELSMHRIRQALDEHVGKETPYVPFHILNGNAGSGPRTAAANVFTAPGVLIPGQSTQDIEDRVEAFWQSLGTSVNRMSADKHDKIFGTTSHLEHTIVFSFMQTQKIADALNERGLTDFGDGVLAFTRIAVAGPIMWAGNFGDNRDKILETAKHFRDSLVAYAQLAAEDKGRGALQNEVQMLHGYAQDKPSKRVTPFAFDSTLGQDTSLNAVVALINMAIAANAQRIEKETGQPFAPLANPSFKDGLGLVAVDPENVVRLLAANGNRIQPAVCDFLREFDKTIRLIESGDTESVKALVVEVGQKRELLPNVFTAHGDMNAAQIPAAKARL